MSGLIECFVAFDDACGHSITIMSMERLRRAVCAHCLLLFTLPFTPFWFFYLFCVADIDYIAMDARWRAMSPPR